MKETTVDSQGRVRCPRCGASDFSDKRTVKGKVLGGAVLAPKRLKCRGCGANLKRGGKPYKGETAPIVSQPAGVVQQPIAYAPASTPVVHNDALDPFQRAQARVERVLTPAEQRAIGKARGEARRAARAQAKADKAARKAR